MFNKKSQAAIEFLTTYGWVLIILVIVIAILASQGFFNTSRYLPEMLDCGEQLSCEEFFLDANANNQQVLSLVVRNNFLREINITKMQLRSDDSDFFDCEINEHTLEIGETSFVACIIPQDEFILDEITKNSIFIELSFKRNATGAQEYSITGLLFAQATSGEYCAIVDEDGTPISDFDNNPNTC